MAAAWRSAPATFSASGTGKSASGTVMEQPADRGEAAVRASPAGGDNVLMAEWAGPYGVVPAFDRMQLADLKPALEAGMAEQFHEAQQ